MKHVSKLFLVIALSVLIIMVVTACGSISGLLGELSYEEATQTISDSGTNAEKAEIVSNPIVDIRWMGFDDDKVGTWNNSLPDGVMDGHFRIRLDMATNQELNGITLCFSDVNRSKGSSYWHTEANDATWILGAFYKGAMLNPSRQVPLGRFSGIVDFDIYATNDGSQVIGNYFLIELDINGIIYDYLIQLQ